MFFDTSVSLIRFDHSLGQRLSDRSLAHQVECHPIGDSKSSEIIAEIEHANKRLRATRSIPTSNLLQVVCSIGTVSALAKEFDMSRRSVKDSCYAVASVFLDQLGDVCDEIASRYESYGCVVHCSAR